MLRAEVLCFHSFILSFFPATFSLWRNPMKMAYWTQILLKIKFFLLKNVQKKRCCPASKMVNKKNTNLDFTFRSKNMNVMHMRHCSPSFWRVYFYTHSTRPGQSPACRRQVKWKEVLKLLRLRALLEQKNLEEVRHSSVDFSSSHRTTEHDCYKDRN